MTSERLQRLRSLAPHVIAAALIALVVGLKAGTLSCSITSDPSGYLNCARRLAEGHLFYPHVGADILQKRFGVVFHESVVHGYLFANPDGRLYPFFGIGFPLILAAVTKLLGVAWAPLTNLFLLPVFLAVYYAFVRFVVRDVPSPRVRFWAPLLSLAVVAWRMEGHLFCWALPYRELPATTLMMAAVIVAGRASPSRAGRWAATAAAGLLAGLAVTIREPVILLGTSVVIGRVWKDGAWRLMFRRAVGYGLLFAALAGVAYAPQLVVNRVWRGSWTGSKQMDVATTNLTRTDFGAEEETVAGLSFFNARHNFPIHVLTVRYAFGWMLPFLVLGLLLGASRPYQRALLLLVPPAVLFVAILSIMGVEPPQPRYDFSYLMLLAPVAALGFAWFVDWLAAMGSRWVSPVWAGAALALALAISVAIPLQNATQGLRTGRPRQSVATLAAFSRDLHAALPAGSLTLAEIPARDYIEYLGPGNSMGLFQVLEQNVSAADWVAACREHGVRLFLFASPNGDPKSVPYQADEWKGLLETEARLTRVKTFAMKPYGLDRMFTAAAVDLYEVTPLDGHSATTLVRTVARQASRLTVRLAARRVTDAPVVKIDGLPVEGRMITPDCFTADVPVPLSSRPAVSIDSTVPIAASPPAELLPREAAFGVRLGCDYSDRAWLDQGWFLHDHPSIAEHHRVLRRSESGLDLRPLRAVYGDKADVFLGVAIEGRPTRPELEWRGQEEAADAWRAAVPCLDANGLVSGFLLPDASLRAPVVLRQGPAGRVRLYGFYVGRLTRDVACPIVSTNDALRLWPVVAFNRSGGGATGEVFLVQSLQNPPVSGAVVRLAADRDSPGYLYMLLPPLPVVADGAVSEPFVGPARLLWQSGFHPPERAGIWSGPEFSVALPPARGPVTVTLRCEDLRPLSAAVTKVRARIGNTPVEARLVRQGSAWDVSVTTTSRTDAAMTPVTVTFEVPSWTPSASLPGNLDRRVLGLLMRGAAFTTSSGSSY